MLLMSPRRLGRSMNTSCSTPLSTTAARASCVLALIRISVPIGHRGPFLPAGHARRAQQLRGLEQRQPHHPREAAAQAADEHGAVSLNRVAAGLVAALTRVPVVACFLGCDLAERDF